MTNETSGIRHRYLALWFPYLPTDRVRIQDAIATRPEAPLVLVCRQRGALRLHAVDEVAQALGLTPGLALADARVREPDLIAIEADEDADAHWLRRLAGRCRRWSPSVTPEGDDRIVIDIAGADHLFGGEAALVAQVGDDFAARGMAVRCALADTATAALALARYGSRGANTGDARAAIRVLPVKALELSPDATQALRRAGLGTLGDLIDRPMATIAARFGAEAVSALRCITGDEHTPIDPLRPAVSLRFEHRFAEPVGHQGAIARCFLDLLQQGAAALEGRALGARRFCLTLSRSDGAARRLDIETALPTRDPAPVLRLFDERIAALADPLDPGFGYDGVTLTLGATEPLLARQPGLGGEKAEAAERALTDLIDRLHARLGEGSVRQLNPRESHIPERGQRALPPEHVFAGRSPSGGAPGNVPVWRRSATGEPPMRPLFMLDPPQPVDVIAQVPDGPPYRFRWRGTLHEIRLHEGPERIAQEWWRHTGGENAGQGGLTRDYYRIEDVEGRRFWIFRHGLYAEKPDPRWYLHGVFA